MPEPPFDCALGDSAARISVPGGRPVAARDGGAGKPPKGTRGSRGSSGGQRSGAVARRAGGSGCGLDAPASHVTTTKRVCEHILKLETRIMIYQRGGEGQADQGPSSTSCLPCIPTPYSLVLQF